ncbi:MAG: putative oxidoreductase YcjS [Clostridia bacterium]|nr:putative oxidoreductase YcjS [Clostridia bacterium]
MYKAALIGCGGISSVHFKAISENADIELIAVCDINNERLKTASEKFGCHGYNDYKEMIKNEHPDVVHICTPHYLHVPMAVYCLEKNINVVLEKPLSTNVEDGKKLIEAANKSSGKIAICFQNRYNATSRKLKEILSSDEFKSAKIYGAKGYVTWARNADYYLKSGWRGKWATEGGGVLINQSIHTLDLIQWLLGDIDNIKGHADTHFFKDVIEVEDTAEMLLTFKNGARCIFYATVGYVDNSPITVDILTDKADFHLDNDLSVKYKDGRTEVYNAENLGVGDKDYWGTSHSLLINDFYSSLKTEGSFWIDPKEAFKTINIIMNIYEQSKIKNL